MTDREKLTAAFLQLRTLGYWARMAQQDGWSAIPVDVIREGRKFVFWHMNEDGAFGPDGNLTRSLHLHHRTIDIHEILKALKAAGVRRLGLAGGADGGSGNAIVVDPGTADCDRETKR